MTTDDPTRIEALALIATISKRLAAGDRYYNKTGEELVTTAQVIVTMRDEGEVSVLPRPDVDFSAAGGFKEASRQSRK